MKCWATRFTISSRAKRSCITRASQGQYDFLLAINLSTLVGVRLDVIQSSDVKVHYGFLGNRLPSMSMLQVLDRFFHLWIIYVYGRWIITQYLTQIKENGNSTTVDSTSGWKSSLGKIYKQYSARVRMSTLNSAWATAQRRQTKTLSTRDRGYTATTNTCM